MLLAHEHRGTGIYNIGTGTETSVRQLYDAIQTVSTIRRDPAQAPARLGELQRSALDPTLAEQAFGWRARYSLYAGLIETWNWVTA